MREDSAWDVPEPELALVCNAKGEIVGYTVGILSFNTTALLCPCTQEARRVSASNEPS